MHIKNCELHNQQSTTIWRLLQSVKSRSRCWNYSRVIQHLSLCYYHYYCIIYIDQHFGAMPCAPSCFKLWPHLLLPLQWLLPLSLPVLPGALEMPDTYSSLLHVLVFSLFCPRQEQSSPLQELPVDLKPREMPEQWIGVLDIFKHFISFHM